MRPRHPLLAVVALIAGLVGVTLLAQPAGLWTGVPGGGSTASGPAADRTADAASVGAQAAGTPDGAPGTAGAAHEAAISAEAAADDSATVPPTVPATALRPAASGRPEDRRPIAVPPIALTIPVLGVFAAPVVAVGLLGSGELEVPPVSEVGWYRFGAHPGEAGSAVLAAHIAYGGVEGVFGRLDQLSPGDEVTLAHVDGGVSHWQVSSVEQFDKDTLPVDRVFSSGGDPVLTLITCGGAFNPSRHSYEDNVVVFARRLA